MKKKIKSIDKMIMKEFAKFTEKNLTIKSCEEFVEKVIHLSKLNEEIITEQAKLVKYTTTKYRELLHENAKLIEENIKLVEEKERGYE